MWTSNAFSIIEPTWNEQLLHCRNWIAKETHVGKSYRQQNTTNLTFKESLFSRPCYHASKGWRTVTKQHLWLTNLVNTPIYKNQLNHPSSSSCLSMGFLSDEPCKKLSQNLIMKYIFNIKNSYKPRLQAEWPWWPLFYLSIRISLECRKTLALTLTFTCMA